MNAKGGGWILSVFLCALVLASCKTGTEEQKATKAPPALGSVEAAQVPTWSRDDMQFFLHGTMSSEIIPENVLLAFMRVYPDLFPERDLSNLGTIPDAKYGWPIGFSRRNVPHFGGLPSIGVNCAACHCTEIASSPGGAPIRVLGVTSHFNAEGFFGAVIISTFRTASDTEHMKHFLSAYLAVCDPGVDDNDLATFETMWPGYEPNISAVLADDPGGSKDIPPGGLQPLTASQLRFDRQSLAEGRDLTALSHSMLKLFHNMRTSLHLPDQPPATLPPESGPGRNDAFGLLAAELFNSPQPFTPVKFGLVWNVENRPWVHWDGNTSSPMGRNLLASIGLGAPLVGKHAVLDFAAIKRQTDITERIHAPRYPFAIDETAAKRGAPLFEDRCAACHSTPEDDGRLYTPSQIGTESHRAFGFTQEQADLFNNFLAELETPGYQPPATPGLRSTQKYWAPSLTGVWARSPYLHNGSVRTMQELLLPPDQRAKSFRRGSRVYDPAQMGYIDDGSYSLDTSVSWNSNAGHDFGTDLSPEEKQSLIEYLKTM